MQWLAQAEVKARLTKEVRAIKEAVQASTGVPYCYPFTAAETLTQDFKRLGSAADGSTYLDYLGCLMTGKLITQPVDHFIPQSPRLLLSASQISLQILV